LTAGYAPGGAVLVSERIARHFDQHVLACGLTTYAHPVVCSAIVGAIEAYRDENLPARAAMLGGSLRLQLEAFAGTRPFIGEVRGIGLLWAFELVTPGTRDPMPAPRMAHLATALRARHLHMHKRDNLLYLAPPLVVTEAELEESLVKIGEAMAEAFA
jgi:taurine--2-oxoglutarate transaminase